MCLPKKSYHRVFSCTHVENRMREDRTALHTLVGKHWHIGAASTIFIHSYHSQKQDNSNMTLTQGKGSVINKMTLTYGGKVDHICKQNMWG